MRTGRIISPGQQEMPPPDPICMECGEECEAVRRDESHHDGMGWVSDWCWVSSCCSAGMARDRAAYEERMSLE
ncbi:MAG: hypothetical protein ACYTEQ_00895 [Planctomycetota bacterium]|jgi:hypothetical protein